MPAPPGRDAGIGTEGLGESRDWGGGSRGGSKGVNASGQMAFGPSGFAVTDDGFSINGGQFGFDAQGNLVDKSSGQVVGSMKEARDGGFGSTQGMTSQQLDQYRALRQQLQNPVGDPDTAGFNQQQKAMKSQLSDLEVALAKSINGLVSMVPGLDLNTVQNPDGSWSTQANAQPLGALGALAGLPSGIPGVGGVDDLAGTNIDLGRAPIGYGETNPGGARAGAGGGGAVDQLRTSAATTAGGAGTGTGNTGGETPGMTNPGAGATPWSEAMRLSKGQSALDALMEQMRGRYRTDFEDAVKQQGLTLNSRTSGQGSLIDELYKDPQLGTVDDILKYVDEQGNVNNKGIETALGAFNDQFGETILSDAQTAERNRFSNAVNQFAGAGFENQLVGQDFYNDAIDRILRERQGDASKMLENSLSRGQLTDRGYDKAYQTLGAQGESARSTLGGLATALADNTRQSLRNRGSQARSNAQNFTLGGNFDPSVAQRDIEGIVGTAREGSYGDLRSKLGTQKLFQAQDALNSGGLAQGQINPGRQSLLGALQAREGAQDRTARRGLGSTGAF